MITFFVPGEPQPGGSKKGFVNRKTGRVVITDDARHNKEWMAVVRLAASQAYQGRPVEGPLQLTLEFVYVRPAGHTGKRGQLRKHAPRGKVSKPDLTKLIRSTEDALSGIVWRDDSQVVRQIATKSYGDRAGCLVKVAPIEEATS